MPTDLFLALTGFTLASAVTPGPNNIMLLASGLNFGMRRTVPHMLGIGVGFSAMLAVMGIGFAQILQTNSMLNDGLKIAGFTYMLWLAWKIARAGAPQSDAITTGAKPMTFLQAALFQWINPKAWAVTLTMTVAYTVADNYLPSLIVIIIVAALITVPNVCLWTYFGTKLSQLMRNPVRVRVFNISMAVLLVASFIPVIIDLF